MIRAAAGLAFAIVVVAAQVRAADVAEPDGYRLEDYRAPDACDAARRPGRHNG